MISNCHIFKNHELTQLVTNKPPGFSPLSNTHVAGGIAQEHCSTMKTGIQNPVPTADRSQNVVIPVPKDVNGLLWPPQTHMSI